jgi:YidC/Oxa1 family membrane protein insertase
MIDWNIILNGANSMLTGNAINMTWQVQADKQQSDIKYERNTGKACFVEDNSYDFKTAATGATKSFEAPVTWLSVKQQFFNSTLIAKNNFSAGDISITVPETPATLLAERPQT